MNKYPSLLLIRFFICVHLWIVIKLWCSVLNSVLVHFFYFQFLGYRDKETIWLFMKFCSDSVKFFLVFGSVGITKLGSVCDKILVPINSDLGNLDDNVVLFVV